MHSFELHAPIGANKKRKVVGRGQGCGRGTTSGRGNKGQKSRSGGKTYVGFEGGQMPLYRRLAHRGFSNYPFKKEYQVVNLVDIEKRFEEGETVDAGSLFAKGLCKSSKEIKILGDGNFSKKLTFQMGENTIKEKANGKKTVLKLATLSKSAKEKIEKAGGIIADLKNKEK
jgi:large subunit ribosomal protein L15